MAKYMAISRVPCDHNESFVSQQLLLQNILVFLLPHPLYHISIPLNDSY